MRWDFLDGVKAIDAAEAVAAEFAKVVVEELRAWPPRVEWTDPAQARRFAALYAPGELLLRRPSDEALRAAFRLARWDLLRHTEAIEDFFRHDRGPAGERLAVELAWRWLVEATLELSERTSGRVARRHLVGCLDRAELLLLGRGEVRG